MNLSSKTQEIIVETSTTDENCFPALANTLNSIKKNTIISKDLISQTTKQQKKVITSGNISTDITAAAAMKKKTALIDKARADKGCDYLSQYTTATIKLKENSIQSNVVAHVNPVNSIVTLELSTSESQKEIKNYEGTIILNINISVKYLFVFIKM